jgi:hypothetical protein
MFVIIDKIGLILSCNFHHLQDWTISTMYLSSLTRLDSIWHLSCTIFDKVGTLSSGTELHEEMNSKFLYMIQSCHLLKNTCISAVVRLGLSRGQDIVFGYVTWVVLKCVVSLPPQL